MCFQRVVHFVTITHHAHVVSCPEGDVVWNTVSGHPSGHTSKIVVEMHVHVSDHPFEALSVAVVPGAETTSLFWP